MALGGIWYCRVYNIAGCIALKGISKISTKRLFLRQVQKTIECVCVKCYLSYLKGFIIIEVLHSSYKVKVVKRNKTYSSNISILNIPPFWQNS